MGLPEDILGLASRAAGVVVNPHGRVSNGRLRNAVDGKVVLVTGASYGIGEATARKLGAAGATVLLAARSSDRLEEVAAGIRASGGDATARQTDLADPDSVDDLVAWALERHDGVDVLVNNAGKSIRRSLALSYDRYRDFQRTIDVNYLGPVKLLLALAPSMRARGSGHIVNVSTIGVRMPPGPRWGAYQASKTAYDLLLRSVASELRKDGVTATSVYMALIHTRMSAPTPIYRYLPGMTPDEAAGLIAHAIVDRPRRISPWWAGAAEVGYAVSRVPWETTMDVLYRLTGDSDTAAARGLDPSERDPAQQVPR